MSSKSTGKARGANKEPAEDEVMPTGREMRLHKFLASTGAGSRRECETFIEQGRVSVDGKVVTKMGFKVDPHAAKVTFDGEKVEAEPLVYWILNKPPNTICTNSDERGRTRVVDLIPDQRYRIYTVGRLDADSRGLILLTNDGYIANIVCHPRYRIEKVYQVYVRGEVDRRQIARIEAGVWLAEGRSSPARVKALGRNLRRDETVLEMTVFEGRNREIRRVLARVGLKVRRLVRLKIGPLALGELPPGASRRLEPAELEFVREAEKLYLANKQAWDAELPAESPKPDLRSQRTKGRRPGGPGHGAGKGRPQKGRKGPARKPGARGQGGSSERFREGPSTYRRGGNQRGGSSRDTERKTDSGRQRRRYYD